MGLNVPSSAPGKGYMLCFIAEAGVGGRDWWLGTAGCLSIPEVYMSVPQEDGKPGCYRHGVWS